MQESKKYMQNLESNALGAQVFFLPLLYEAELMLPQSVHALQEYVRPSL